MEPAIDAHHHIWRQADLPWLLGPMQPRIFGPYEPIRRDYEIREYLDDIAGHGVVGSVYVQANWPADRAADEIAYVARAAQETGWPQAIVGYADLTVPDVRPQLDRIATQPLLRGIRMQLHWHENPQYRFAARPDLAADPVLQRNVARLGEYGLVFELQVFAAQFAGAAALAEACPGVTFVLQHAGMPEDLSPAGLAAWREGLALLALRPNVLAKLSGLGTFIHRNDAAHVAAIAGDTLAAFGPGRCLFGSNFPIEKLWCGYGELIAAHRAAIAHLSPDDRRAVLHDVAARTYRIGTSGGHVHAA
jgi:predicted TIM-barrel fold metal-dependent hydrolase